MIILLGVRGKLDIISPFPFTTSLIIAVVLSLVNYPILYKKKEVGSSRITPDGLSSQPLDTLPQVLSPI